MRSRNQCTGLWGRCRFSAVYRFFLFGSRSGAVAGWGSIFGVLWSGSLRISEAGVSVCCVGSGVRAGGLRHFGSILSLLMSEFE